MNKRFKLFENGDTIFLPNNKKLSWRDDDALPFAFNYVHKTGVKDFTEYGRGKYHRFIPGGREHKFVGRVWENSKILTFWQAPSDTIMLDCLKVIEEKLNLKILNNGWKIEIRKRKSVIGTPHKTKIVYELILIEEYVRSVPDTKGYLTHLDHKKNTPVPPNFGSNSHKRKPLPLRQAMYAESVKYNESAETDLIEKVLDVKAKFMLCTRCGNQIHHGLTICSRCGKDNGINKGSTVGKILYTRKHRQITKDPIEYISPEIIYDTYKGQMPGVSFEEFEDYIDKFRPKKKIHENFITKFEKFGA